MHKPAGFLAALLFSVPVLAGQLLVIDVRTAEEYRQGHVQDALNIPYDEIASRIAAVTSDHDTSIVLYCRSGRRAGIAEQALRQIGYGRIENKGGLDDMKRGGYSIQ
ncbi:MAG: rhodanese-like domain-containing protein [Candidatus Competibacteraceae bacterium]|nr:rhodanese-like domain-containing protein [Candidatus Competibacteraceae bacterium]